MTRRQWVLLGCGALLLIVATLWWRRVTHPSESMRPETRDTLTVLKATKTADSVAHASLIAKAETLSVVARHHEAAGRVLVQQGERDAMTGDSLAKLAAIAKTAEDSAAAWQRAYRAESLSVSKLKLAHVQDSLALFNERARGDSIQRADSINTTRLARVERANVMLQQDIVNANKCFVVFHVPCPSRTVSAGLGVAAVLGARAVLAH